MSFSITVSSLGAPTPSLVGSSRMAVFAASLATALASGVAAADIVSPTVVIRPGELVTAEHLTLAPGEPRPGDVADAGEAVGLEARSTLYPGRPIPLAHLGPQTVVERGTMVSIRFIRGALVLEAMGRAVDGGGVGETVRVMNLDSRLTVHGVVAAPGLVEVGGLGPSARLQ